MGYDYQKTESIERAAKEAQEKLQSVQPRSETVESIQIQAGSNIEGTVSALMAADRILGCLNSILYGKGQNPISEAKPQRVGPSPLAAALQEEGYLITQLHERLSQIESLIHH